MADHGLFIGWGAPVRGREQTSVQVFGEAVDFFQGLQQRGEIESIEPVFLEPHGGDLSGFFLIRGEAESLARLRNDDAFVRLLTRAAMIVESLGVVGASLGDRIGFQTGLFQEAASELGS